MLNSELEIVAETDRKHVSNVKLFEYLDWGRQEWYRFCVSVGVEAVVVHIGTSYKIEVFHGDQLKVETRLERIGNTSFMLKQWIFKQHGGLAVEAEVVLATIDRKTRQKVRVPDAVREIKVVNNT